jgi:competence protein ComEC
VSSREGFRAPDRRRTAGFRPPLRAGTPALYPLHAALAGLVFGLVAGPRAPAAVLVASAIASLAAMGAVRRRTPFEVPLPPSDDEQPEGVETTARPATLDVRPARVAATCAAIAVAVLTGAVVADERLHALDATTLAPAEDVRLSGFVGEPPRVRSFGTTVVPVRLHRPRETILIRAPARVRMPELRVGDEVIARGDLRGLRRRERFERRRGVHAVLEAERVGATGGRRGSPVDRVRRRAEDALAAGLPAEQAALARGMVLGQDQALPEDLREAFRASGLAHLLAASGQNVMLLAALVLALLTVVGVPLRARLAVAIVAVIAYVPLAGAGPSIQRAGVMGAAGLVAAMASRPASRWYALLLAAAVTLVLDPRAAEEPGWQLSFAAVLAILAVHRTLRAALVERGAPGALADVTAVTVAATLGTAPLLSLHFGELSLVSLPANVLAAPAVAPVMWLGTLAGALGGPAPELLNSIAAFPLAYLAWLARAAASLPYASVAAELPGPLAALAIYALIAAVWLASRAAPLQRARRWADGAARGAARPRRAAAAVLATLDGLDRAAAALVTAGILRRTSPPIEEIAAGVRPRTAMRLSAVVPLVVVAVALGLLLAPRPPRPPDEPTLSVLDVGQGDAVLLQDGPHAVLFDTGPPGAPLVRELRRAGVRRLGAVVVTHSSSDHEGGLPALLAAMPVDLVLDGRGPGREHGGEGGGARFAGLPPRLPRGVPAAGQVLRAGRIEIEVLWPPPGEERRDDPNLTAVVALARAGGVSALLAADAESPVTLPLDLPRVDVLKVAHHGSEDEGLPALLERLRPRTAVIPVGRNTYGHPAPGTLRALRAATADVRRTDRDGTVRVPLTSRAPPVAR